GLRQRRRAVRPAGFGGVGADDGAAVGAPARAKGPLAASVAAVRREARKDPIPAAGVRRVNSLRAPPRPNITHAILCASRASRHDARDKVCESALRISSERDARYLAAA